MLFVLTLHDLKRKIVTVAISTTAKYQTHIPSKNKGKKKRKQETKTKTKGKKKGNKRKEERK
jgi:hypothetical protein